MEDILLLGGVKPTQTARRLCEKAVTLAGNSKYTPLLVTRLGRFVLEELVIWFLFLANLGLVATSPLLQ
jgi:hypothetical protein